MHNEIYYYVSLHSGQSARTCRSVATARPRADQWKSLQVASLYSPNFQHKRRLTHCFKAAQASPTSVGTSALSPLPRLRPPPGPRFLAPRTCVRACPTGRRLCSRKSNGAVDRSGHRSSPRTSHPMEDLNPGRRRRRSEDGDPGDGTAQREATPGVRRGRNPNERVTRLAGAMLACCNDRRGDGPGQVTPDAHVFYFFWVKYVWIDLQTRKKPSHQYAESPWCLSSWAVAHTKQGLKEAAKQG